MVCRDPRGKIRKIHWPDKEAGESERFAVSMYQTIKLLNWDDGDYIDIEIPLGEDCFSLNFENIYKKYQVYKGSMMLHWLYCRAMDEPGIWFVHKHAEQHAFKKHIYPTVVHFDGAKMHTNRLGCPVVYNHHLYKTCKVCGQHG